MNKVFLIILNLIMITSCTYDEKKALIVVTNHNVKGETGEQTGWYLSEVSHVYYPLIAKGYKIEFASPKGGIAEIDKSSIKLEDEENKKFFNDVKLMKSSTQETIALKDIKPKEYKILHFAGGHGAMWDFPANKEIQRVTQEVYENGGVVAAICHGPAALVDVKLSNGDYLIKGKSVSMFTNEEERAVKLEKFMPFMLETVLAERGAKVQPASNWSDKVSVDERLVTGQNPQSAKSLVNEIIKLAK